MMKGVETPLSGSQRVPQCEALNPDSVLFNHVGLAGEAVRSLTSAVSLGNDICGPPHCSDKRPHASPDFTAQEEEEEEEEEEEAAQLRGLSAGQRETRPLMS
ncbi:hypothetical protein PAMA_001809 [Pampus argenteus]